MDQETSLSRRAENRARFWIATISVAVPIVVALLLYIPPGESLKGLDVMFLPHLNGVLNSATAILLILGLVFIKQKKERQHKSAMLSALLLGALFLVSYVVYHASTEPTRFGGEGTARTVYFAILISHIILAAIVLPFVLFAAYFGWVDKRSKHRKVVRWAFPIWLYVSITGVIAYLMIRPYY